MKLADYLKGKKQADFAAKVGVTQGMISHWLAGRCRVTAEMAQVIEKATRGKITRHDLRPDIYGKPPRKAA